MATLSRAPIDPLDTATVEIGAFGVEAGI